MFYKQANELILPASLCGRQDVPIHCAHLQQEVNYVNKSEIFFNHKLVEQLNAEFRTPDSLFSGPGRFLPGIMENKLLCFGAEVSAIVSFSKEKNQKAETLKHSGISVVGLLTLNTI